MSTTSKNRGSHTPVRSRSSPVPVPVPAPVPSPPPPDIRSLWRALPPGPCPSPRSHDPTDREIIGAIATVWCLYWNSFSTMDAAGLRIRILAKHPSWNLSEKRVQSVRKSALADGRLRRPAFEANIRMQPTAEEVCAREHAYEFDPLWRMVGRAQVCELLGSFEITSGEVVWGQLPAFVAGMKCASRDRDASDSEDEPPWRFRAAAKNGTWRISRVNAAPDRYSYLPEPTGFLLHHSDVSASVALLRARCGATGPRASRASDLTAGIQKTALMHCAQSRMRIRRSGVRHGHGVGKCTSTAFDQTNITKTGPDGRGSMRCAHEPRFLQTPRMRQRSCVAFHDLQCSTRTCCQKDRPRSVQLIIRPVRRHRCPSVVTYSSPGPRETNSPGSYSRAPSRRSSPTTMNSSRFGMTAATWDTTTSIWRTTLPSILSGDEPVAVRLGTTLS
ncbi:hypothetical protein BC834DRAFT_271648 [Gloeopeniophorella convolvens]|nr:hypothetical protein BC834DRAFT_271648 [Gloeopeniophorella convolvens]